MAADRIATLEELLVRLEDADAESPAIGWDIMHAVAPALDRQDRFPAERLQDAVLVTRASLPNWWWTAGLCGLTGHASIGPDYNGPQGDWLRKVFPEEIFDGGFDADLAPGDGIGRVCRALLHCVVQAHIAIAEQEAANVR